MITCFMSSVIYYWIANICSSNWYTQRKDKPSKGKIKSYKQTKTGETKWKNVNICVVNSETLMFLKKNYNLSKALNHLAIYFASYVLFTH